ncbi:hypothetical protein KC853_00070 [Candidatus Saccharibacteria bacterium]|nr:hypothetical protein [Candidatus Saccharibacteria bacterium]MCB9834655.1 hypothetical protein [Candidatus Nomurabacteria bacterium]
MTINKHSAIIMAGVISLVTITLVGYWIGQPKGILDIQSLDLGDGVLGLVNSDSQIEWQFYDESRLIGFNGRSFFIYNFNDKTFDKLVVDQFLPKINNYSLSPDKQFIIFESSGDLLGSLMYNILDQKFLNKAVNYLWTLNIQTGEYQLIGDNRVIDWVWSDNHTIYYTLDQGSSMNIIYNLDLERGTREELTRVARVQSLGKLNNKLVIYRLSVEGQAVTSLIEGGQETILFKDKYVEFSKYPSRYYLEEKNNKQYHLNSLGQDKGVLDTGIVIDNQNFSFVGLDLISYDQKSNKLLVYQLANHILVEYPLQDKISDPDSIFVFDGSVLIYTEDDNLWHTNLDLPVDKFEPKESIDRQGYLIEYYQDKPDLQFLTKDISEVMDDFDNFLSDQGVNPLLVPITGLLSDSIYYDQSIL